MRFPVAGHMADTIPNGRSRIRHVKRWRAAFAAMPEIIEVMTHATNDIQSIKLKIIASTGPVQMHVSEALMTWLTKSVAAQVASGDVHSAQAKTGWDIPPCAGDDRSESSQEDWHCR